MCVRSCSRALRAVRWRFALLLTLALAAAACGGGSSTLSDSGPVLSAIPWTAPETASYRISTDGEQNGTAELRVEADGGSVKLTQEFDFPGQGVKDTIAVEADALSLRPQRVSRTIDGPEGQRVWDARYEGNSVTVDQHSEKDRRTDTLDVPTRSFDSWSDLFLWRTLAFADGYEVSYQDVLSSGLGKPELLSVVLKVKPRETVSVPAGEYQAWRLEIRSGGETQTAWYADDARRTLVRYDNGDLVFELESQE